MQQSELIGIPPPSIKVAYKKDFQPSEAKNYAASTVSFHNMDAIDYALQIGNDKVLILNLADDIYPGGCVLSGSGAQEESIFRRTNYHKTLHMESGFYPLLDGQAIYSPNVTVFKESEANNWAPLSHQLINLIAGWGIKYPSKIYNKDKDREELRDDDVIKLKERIEVVIQTAHLYGYTTIVLGALGCGAWRNPIQHVAEIFKEILDRYDGVVKHYAFAILTTDDDDHVFAARMRGLSPTVEVFENVFKGVAN